MVKCTCSNSTLEQKNFDFDFDFDFDLLLDCNNCGSEQIRIEVTSLIDELKIVAIKIDHIIQIVNSNLNKIELLKPKVPKLKTYTESIIVKEDIDIIKMNFKKDEINIGNVYDMIHRNGFMYVVLVIIIAIILKLQQVYF